MVRNLEQPAGNSGDVLYCETCNQIIGDEMALYCPACGSSLTLKNLDDALFFSMQKTKGTIKTPLSGFMNMPAKFYKDRKQFRGSLSLTPNCLIIKDASTEILVPLNTVVHAERGSHSNKLHVVLKNGDERVFKVHDAKRWAKKIEQLLSE